MEYLPPAVQTALEGAIDPRSQHLLESLSQTILIALTLVSFALSYLSGSVLLGLEAFAGGFVLLLLAAVPPWPYLNRHPVKFLPVRKLHDS